MMLVQKQPTFNLTQVVPYTHRRHPSAPPAVVVQPTRTPGLLSISKPVRTTPQRHLPSNQRNNVVRTAPKSKQQPLVARAPALLNPAEITEKRPALAVLQPPSSPTPQNRGRAAAKHGKDKLPQTKRSASQSSVRGKHGRQPSPPVEVQSHPPSQAEASLISSSNLFDPFLDSSDAQANDSKIIHPSSKFARPRQTQQLPSPAPSEAIPVPNVSRPQLPPISRSDPVASYMRPPKSTSSNGVAWKFPVCDDNVDFGDSSELDSPVIQTPPATPIRKQTFGNNMGLVTAPISLNSPAGFPFTYPSPPPSQKRGRKHRRSPSEGVFNMSSDEDIATGLGGMVLHQNFFPFNRSPNGKPPTTPSPSLSRATAAAVARELNFAPQEVQTTAGYYASSLFQNSPSPDELPDPLLF